MTKMHGKNTATKLPPMIEGESELEYGWFRLFCLAGYDRSLGLVTDSLLKGDPSADRKKLYRKVTCVSARFNWAKRSQDFDLNSITNLLDKAIEEQAGIEAEWVNRYSQTMALYRDILGQNIKASQCNRVMIDAVHERLEKDKSPSTIIRLQKVVADAVSSNLNILKACQFCLQIKEDTDSIAIGKRAVESHLLD